MNKTILILCIISLCISDLYAQNPYAQKPPVQQVPKPGTAQKPGTTTQTIQKLPSPYLLKKDFESKMQEISSSINAASNSNAGLRNEVAEKLDKLNEIDIKMQSVEQILNSANFQIATTSDSLKKTQFSIDEFRKETEATIAALKAKDEQILYMWVAIGISLLLSVYSIFRMTGKLNSVRRDTTVQLDIIRKKLETDLNDQQQEVKSEVQSARGKMSGEITHLKNELVTKMNAEQEVISQQLQSIMTKLNESK